MDSRSAAAAAADYMAGVERSLFLQAAGLMTPPHAHGSSNSALFSPPLGDTASGLPPPAAHAQPRAGHGTRYLSHLSSLHQNAGRPLGPMIGAFGAELPSAGGALSSGPSPTSDQLKGYYAGLSSQIWASHPMSAAGHRERASVVAQGSLLPPPPFLSAGLLDPAPSANVDHADPVHRFYDYHRDALLHGQSLSMARGQPSMLPPLVPPSLSLPTEGLSSTPGLLQSPCQSTRRPSSDYRHQHAAASLSPPPAKRPKVSRGQESRLSVLTIDTNEAMKKEPFSSPSAASAAASRRLSDLSSSGGPSADSSFEDPAVKKEPVSAQSSPSDGKNSARDKVSGAVSKQEPISPSAGAFRCQYSVTPFSEAAAAEAKQKRVHAKTFTPELPSSDKPQTPKIKKSPATSETSSSSESSPDKPEPRLSAFSSSYMGEHSSPYNLMLPPERPSYYYPPHPAHPSPHLLIPYDPYLLQTYYSMDERHRLHMGTDAFPKTPETPRQSSTARETKREPSPACATPSEGSSSSSVPSFVKMPSEPRRAVLLDRGDDCTTSVSQPVAAILPKRSEQPKTEDEGTSQANNIPVGIAIALQRSKAMSHAESSSEADERPEGSDRQATASTTPTPQRSSSSARRREESQLEDQNRTADVTDVPESSNGVATSSSTHKSVFKAPGSVPSRHPTSAPVAITAPVSTDDHSMTIASLPAESTPFGSQRWPWMGRPPVAVISRGTSPVQELMEDKEIMAAPVLSESAVQASLATQTEAMQTELTSNSDAQTQMERPLCCAKCCGTGVELLLKAAPVADSKSEQEDGLQMLGAIAEFAQKQGPSSIRDLLGSSDDEEKDSDSPEINEKYNAPSSSVFEDEDFRLTSPGFIRRTSVHAEDEAPQGGIFKVSTDPEEMDALELDMRMRLAELQQRYKHKQRELSRLQKHTRCKSKPCQTKKKGMKTAQITKEVDGSHEVKCTEWPTTHAAGFVSKILDAKKRNFMLKGEEERREAAKQGQAKTLPGAILDTKSAKEASVDSSKHDSIYEKSVRNSLPMNESCSTQLTVDTGSSDAFSLCSEGGSTNFGLLAKLASSQIRVKDSSKTPTPQKLKKKKRIQEGGVQKVKKRKLGLPKKVDEDSITETIVARKPKGFNFFSFGQTPQKTLKHPPTSKVKSASKVDSHKSRTPSTKAEKKKMITPKTNEKPKPKAVEKHHEDNVSRARAQSFSIDDWQRRRSERIFLNEAASLHSPSSTCSSSSSVCKVPQLTPPIKPTKPETAKTDEARESKEMKESKESKEVKPPTPRPAQRSASVDVRMDKTSSCEASALQNWWKRMEMKTKAVAKPTQPPQPSQPLALPSSSSSSSCSSSSSSSSSDSDSDSSSDTDNVPLSTLRKQPEPIQSCVISKDDLVDGLKILFFKEGLFYEAQVKSIQPPDVYGVTIDGERGSRPHILPQEELLKEGVLDVTVKNRAQLTEGMRVCAYWSKKFSCLYPGTVSKSSSPLAADLVPVEFDDGDSGNISLEHIRLLPNDFPLQDVETTPLVLAGRRKKRAVSEDWSHESQERKLLTTEITSQSEQKSAKSVSTCKARTVSLDSVKPKKTEVKRELFKVDKEPMKKPLVRADSSDSSSDSSSSSSEAEEERTETSDETYEPPVPKRRGSTSSTKKTPQRRGSESGGKAAPRDRQSSAESSKMAAFLPAQQLWHWLGPGTKRPGAKGRAKKTYYKSIQRGNEILNVGDCAVFLSTGRPNLPYVGRIESLWEGWGAMMAVRVKWFYHPEETKGGKRLQEIKGALYQSPHEDENDVQTISHKCQVLSFCNYKAHRARKMNSLKNKGLNPQEYENDDVYYLAGTYEPTIGMITFADDVRLIS